MMCAPEAVAAFLVGLEKLTRETGVAIWGCGCCGSPSLATADVSDERSGYGYDGCSCVMWIAPSDKYDWETYSEKIVREEGGAG